jgi:hypothetical protein
MKVPKRVHLDAVEAGSLQAKKSVAPELPWDSGVLHSGGHDKRALAMDEKAFAIEIDG